MSTTRDILAATVLAGLLSLAGFGTADAGDTSTFPATLKPISGQGASPDQKFLLNHAIGKKQAVSYFQNQDGRCKLTLMVGEAFNGEDVPDETVVRFELRIAPAKAASFDTAQGKGLEFKCLDGAQAMSVRALDQIAGYGPAM
jgi:hypothetical protein